MATHPQQRAGKRQGRHPERIGQIFRRADPLDVGKGNVFNAQPPVDGEAVTVDLVFGAIKRNRSVCEKGLKDGMVELKPRKEKENLTVALDDLTVRVKAFFA